MPTKSSAHEIQFNSIHRSSATKSCPPLLAIVLSHINTLQSKLFSFLFLFFFNFSKELTKIVISRAHLFF